MNPGWSPSSVALDMMEETPLESLTCADPDLLWVSYGYGQSHGYAYVFPKNGHVNVGIGFVLQRFRDDIDEPPYGVQTAFVASLCRTGVLAGRSSRQHFTPALIPIAGPLKRTAGDRVTLIGDAGGFVNAFSAEGIYYAMVSGELAARSLLAEAPGTFERAWRSEIGPELRDAVLVQRYLFTRPTRIDAMVRGARLHPAIAREVIDHAMGRVSYRRARGRFLLKLVGAAITNSKSPDIPSSSPVRL
jgi:flavin-dependent dehydrogenase